MPVVVVDACVLAPARLCDLFLRLAEEPRGHMPRWSSEILDEVWRTQVQQLRYPERLADYWREQVTSAFPEALVAGYDALLDQCQCDAGDRHVLAAAMQAGAEAIVTFNLRHFPASALEPHGLAVRHPADYLMGLYTAEPQLLIRRLAEIGAVRQIEAPEVLHRLSRSVPAFVAHVAERQGW